MPRTVAYRKYQLTMNNPLEHGFSHEAIKQILGTFPSCQYWCMCDEEGSTYHTHIYLVFRNAVAFQTIHQRFYGAHIEPAHGTHQENRDYIRKEGSYLNTEKAETNLADTFEESGALPSVKDKRIQQSEAILSMVESGVRNAEILREYPSVMNRLPHIEQARQTLLEEKYSTEFRKLCVTYLYGSAGVGKTRFVMEQHGYREVYRVTNYLHPFDSYQGQSVLLFDEFRSSLPLTDMLNYLDGYPLMLPCRYADRVACYTTVYLVSNIPLEKQYPLVQQAEIESYRAFLRRIHAVYEMKADTEWDSLVSRRDSDAE